MCVCVARRPTAARRGELERRSEAERAHTLMETPIVAGMRRIVGGREPPRALGCQGVAEPGRAGRWPLPSVVGAVRPFNPQVDQRRLEKRLSRFVGRFEPGSFTLGGARAGNATDLASEESVEIATSRDRAGEGHSLLAIRRCGFWQRPTGGLMLPKPTRRSGCVRAAHGPATRWDIEARTSKTGQLPTAASPPRPNRASGVSDPAGGDWRPQPLRRSAPFASHCMTMAHSIRKRTEKGRGGPPRGGPKSGRVVAVRLAVLLAAIIWIRSLGSGGASGSARSRCMSVTPSHKRLDGGTPPY